MLMPACARFRAPLTILLAFFSTAVAAQVPGPNDSPSTCNAAAPEGGERLMRKLKVKVYATIVETERVLIVKLENNGKAPALGTQLTLVDAQGLPIVSAIFSDNCLSVMPGEPATVYVRYSADSVDSAEIKIQGQNFKPATARVPSASSGPYLPTWQQPVYTPPAPTVKSATVVVPKR